LEALSFIPLGIVIFLLGLTWWLIRTKITQIERNLEKVVSNMEKQIKEKVDESYFQEFKKLNREDHQKIIDSLEKVAEKINNIEKDIILIKASDRRQTGEI